MTLSTFQPPFLSPKVAPVGVGDSAAIFYSQISGIAD